MGKRDFIIKRILVNEVLIKRVVVDDHVEKHKDITDEMILKLVTSLNGVIQAYEDSKPPYKYFVTLIEYKKKKYKMVWLLEEEQSYIGIITIHREKRSLKWPFLIKKN